MSLRSISSAQPCRIDRIATSPHKKWHTRQSAPLKMQSSLSVFRWQPLHGLTCLFPLHFVSRDGRINSWPSQPGRYIGGGQIETERAQARGRNRICIWAEGCRPRRPNRRPEVILVEASSARSGEPTEESPSCRGTADPANYSVT